MSEEAVERFTLQDYYTPSPERRSVGRFWRLLGSAVGIVWRAAPRSLLRAAAMQLVVGIALSVQLLLLRGLLADLVGGSPTFSAAAPELAGLLAIGVLVAVVGVALELEQRVLGQLVALDTADAMVRAAGSVELLAYESPQFHDGLMRAQLSAASRPVQLTQGLLGIMGTAVSIIGIATALLLIEPLFCVLVLVAFVPALMASNRAGRLIYRYSVEQTELERRRSYLFHVLTTRPQAQEIRAFGLPEYLGRRHRQLGEQLLDNLRAVLRQRMRIALVGQLTSALLSAAALAALVWFVTSGRMSLADAGAAAGAMVLLSGRLRGLAGGAGGLYEAALYLEDFLSFVEVSRRLDAAAPDAPAPAGTDAIIAQGVSFTYPSREDPSLHGASIVVRRGEVVALVGENGSGKTTFAKLLAGLYPAQAGTITLDGVDIAACDPAAVRQRVAVIFQDFMRYELSAYDNVAVGDHTRFDDREAVEQAARAAGIHDVIAGMPYGYDTLLGAEYVGGTDLSGGQWQRVALARAFFRQAPIVILDEPTAALDPRAEARLYESMRELFAGRGVLLISHRFASVRTADRIYVLEGGRVIEEGTHDALMAADGHYAELFRMQAARYVD